MRTIILMVFSRGAQGGHSRAWFTSAATTRRRTHMKRLVPIGLALALLVAACGGSADDGVASLSGENGDQATATDEATTEQDLEEAILAFSACMRENGIEDFQDPQISEDGGIAFQLGSGGGDPPTAAEREETQQAFQACSGLLEGQAFGPGAAIDTGEIEDRLYEFAACMRENGYDMPDPDLSAIGPQEEGSDPGEFQSPFGDIDPDDPAFQTAAEACQEVFGGGFVIGGPGGPGGQGGPPGGGLETTLPGEGSDEGDA
jgi:hypothetical protein